MGTVKYTGPVASFHCPTNAEIRSLKVHFSPKQLGEGTPSPENVREIVGWDGVEVEQRGKNLIDISPIKHGHPSIAYHSSDEPNDMIFANGELSGTVTEGWRDTTVFSQLKPFNPGTYTLSFDYENKAKNYSWRPICITSTYSGWYTAYKSVAAASSEYGHIISTFTADAPFYISMCLNSFGYAVITAKNRIYNIKLELSSTSTPYEPYRGETTTYEFGVLGKNKFDKDAEPLMTGAYVDYSSVVGEPIRTYSHQNYKIYKVPITPNTTYTFGTIKANDPCWALIDADNNVTHVAHNNGGTSGTTVTFTAGQNDCYLLLSVAFQSTYKCDDVLQLELGSTATTYESYDPKSIVYGGWVDLISGEVCEEDYHIVVDGVNVKCNRDYSNASYISAGIVYLAPNGKSDAHYKRLGLNVYCDSIPMYGGADDDPTDALPFAKSTNSGSQYIRFYVANTEDHPELDTAQKKIDFVNEYLAEHPANIVYKLTTPNTYHLAPTTLQTFLGHNNVWSNADYVEVEYDLHETQSLLQRKAFIMANQPHIVKPAAAALQNFKTDVIAPLKECKVHFSPVQEGTGDPSPSNVRPISGWTGVEVTRCGKNMFDNTKIKTGKYVTWNNYETEHSSYSCSEYIEIKPNTYYTVTVPKYTAASAAGQLFLSDTLSPLLHKALGGYTKIGNTDDEEAYYTCLSPSNAKYLRISWANHIGDNCQIEEGQTRTSYEPYSGTTLPIDWTTEAGTVYGGYIDLISGEVWADTFLADPNGWTMFKQNNGFKAYSQTLPRFVSGGYRASNIISTFGTFSSGNMNKNIIQVQSSSSAYTTATAYVSLDENIDITTLQYVSQTNIPQLVGTIDPITLKTLRGTNNIWSNANGNIELAYWSH